MWNNDHSGFGTVDQMRVDVLGVDVLKLDVMTLPPILIDLLQDNQQMW